MQALVKYFIRYKVSGNVLLLLIILFGAMGLSRMNSTFFPDVPTRYIAVQIVYPGTSPEEIEESVVQKIENELKGITGIERITSKSIENAASISIETTQKSDVDDVLQDVKNGVNRIASIPAGVERMDVYKIENISNAISFAITGNEASIADLKKVSRGMEREILAIKGISKVELSGFPEEEISIQFSEDRLRAYNITLQQAQTAIASANIDITGGTIRGEQEELRIRSRNKQYIAADMGNIVIRGFADGNIVYLKDVAELLDQWAESPARNFYNGLPAVTVDVKHTAQQDLLNITDTIKGYLQSFNQSQQTYTAYVTRDGSTVVRQRIDLLLNNGMIGFVLVFILLGIFLHYRIAFWVALSIPISFAGMFVLAPFFGITINVISLFGMITVIGILVDDGVVISENIYRHYEKGKSATQAAIDGTLEVLPAVTAAVLTTIVAFCSFYFIEGRLGDFFWQMAFIVIATLLFSLVEGAFILPAHIAHSKALKRKGKKNAVLQFTDNTMHFLRMKLYKPLLEYSLRNKALALAIPLALFILTIGALKGSIIKTTFFPFIERDQITVTLKMPAGTPKEKTNAVLERIEQGVWQVSQHIQSERADSAHVVRAIDKRLGPANPFEGTIYIKLLDGEARNLSILTIAQQIRQQIGTISEAEQLTFGSASAFGKPISVSFQGYNMEQVRGAAEQFKKALANLNDLKDITDSDSEGLREVQVQLKPAAYLLGFNEQQITQQIRQAFFGAEVQRIQRGQDEVRVWVRYKPSSRASISDLKNMRIRNQQGQEYPLNTLADFNIERGVIQINHTDGEREITVGADISNSKVSVSDLVRSIKKDILPTVLQAYPEVHYSMEGQSRQQAKTTGSIKRIMPVIMILMLAIIVFTFRSFSQTFLILLLIPMAFTGVAWGHWLHDMPISLFSMLGIIALIGILINDSIVFVTAFNSNIRQGMDFQEALMDAALSRFRPILLTSITTIGGLAPLMLEKSMQAQFLIPMAIAVAYGLAIATGIILIILPVLMVYLNDIKRFIHWYWYGNKLTPKEVEPAYKEIANETIEETTSIEL